MVSMLPMTVIIILESDLSGFNDIESSSCSNRSVVFSIRKMKVEIWYENNISMLEER